MLTHDVRLTTHDEGCQPIVIGHLSDLGDLIKCKIHHLKKILCLSPKDIPGAYLVAIVVKFFKTVNLLSQFPNYPLGKGLALHLLLSQGLFVPSLPERGVMEKMKISTNNNKHCCSKFYQKNLQQNKKQNQPYKQLSSLKVKVTIQMLTC